MRATRGKKSSIEKHQCAIDVVFLQFSSPGQTLQRPVIIHGLATQRHALTKSMHSGPVSIQPGEPRSVPQEMLDKYIGKSLSEARQSPTGTLIRSPTSRKATPPKLDLQVIKMGGMLPLSPPASPPFSPTDNNREGNGVDLVYPAGNWSFDQRSAKAADPVDW